MEWNRCRNLVKVKRETQEAVFDIVSNGQSTGRTQTVKVCSSVYEISYDNLTIILQ